jgi:glycosyltransferase involved in cell wall biosynthesis
MKILITINDYSQLTGAEMYVYELARELVLLKHDVTISARRVGGLIKVKSEQVGCKVISFGDLDYSQKFDIIHLNTPNSSLYISMRFKGTPMVYSSHSEFHVEKPQIEYSNTDVKKYIAIRESIRDKWQFPDCVVIPNPIDFRRFNTDCPTLNNKLPLVLFPATFDPLRINAIRHLVVYCKNHEMNLLFCGIRMVNGYEYDYLHTLLNEYVKHIEPIWRIDSLIKQCDYVAGIEVGRTTLEGWACGKKGIIYYLDYDKAFREDTNIKKMEILDPPSDIGKYDSRVIAKQIEKVYQEAIGK